MSEESEKRDKIESDYHRFRGVRYTMSGPSTSGPSQMIPEEVSLYAFPRHEPTTYSLLDIDLDD